MSSARHELEELLDVEDVGRILKKKRDAIYKMAERRQIPHYRIGKTLRFSPSAIQAWLAERAARPFSRKG